jgi:hypothetical protein
VSHGVPRCGMLPMGGVRALATDEEDAQIIAFGDGHAEHDWIVTGTEVAQLE